MTQEQIEMADQILKDLGLENLNDPLRSELVETIHQRIQQKVLLIILENLPKEETASLEQAIQGKSEEEIIQEMTKRIPDLNTKISEGLSELYNELLEDTQQVVNSAKSA